MIMWPWASSLTSLSLYFLLVITEGIWGLKERESAWGSHCSITVKTSDFELEDMGLKPHSTSTHWQFDFRYMLSHSVVSNSL